MIRLDPKTKAALQKIAKNEGRSVSDVMRQLVQDYIKDKDMAAYIDDVWSRMGSKMKQSKVDEKKIREAIKEVRKAK